MSDPVVGAKAPAFTLPRDGGSTISLADFAGKTVVLYFYPKDDTSGCTTESLDFTARAADFAAANAVIVGMSADPVKSHDKFVKKHGLGVILASDEETSTLQAYGVWKEKSMYGKTYMGIERTTLVIGPDGTILERFDKVKVAGHADQVLEAVKRHAG